MYRGIIRQYRTYLPVDESAIVTLNEGQTPLIEANRLKEALGLKANLYLKFEGLNPTGSFKDRGMTYAVSKAKEEGAKTIICASTGNTSASAAAYAAKAKMKCVVLIPEGSIAFGKLSQAMIHGARVIQIKGNFDEALQMVRDAGQNYPIHIVNSINPYRLMGQMTGSFEICEALGKAPDFHFLPVGNAGNISAYWQGYQKFFEEKKITQKPKMMGFQALGAAPIVDQKPVLNPQTVASAIKIGNPASWKLAEKARDESGGQINKISDEKILEAYKLVASLDGVFCEPASAISIAGVIEMQKTGFLDKAQNVVCTLTGHGLKDPDIAVKQSAKPEVIKPDINELVKILGF